MCVYCYGLIKFCVQGKLLFVVKNINSLEKKKSDRSNENGENQRYRNIAVFHLLSLRGQFRKAEWRGLVYELSSRKIEIRLFTNRVEKGRPRDV